MIRLPAASCTCAADTEPLAWVVWRATGICPAARSSVPRNPVNSESLARKRGVRPLSKTSRAHAIGSSTETWLATTSTGPRAGIRSPCRYRSRNIIDATG